MATEPKELLHRDHAGEAERDPHHGQASDGTSHAPIPSVSHTEQRAERLRLYMNRIGELEAEVERLAREIRALRQDDGAVIAKLQAVNKQLTAEIERLRVSKRQRADLDKEIIWATSTTGEDFQCVDESFAREQQAEIERLRMENAALRRALELKP